MAEASPVIFNGPLHGAALADARQLASERKIDVPAVLAIVEARVSFWFDRSRASAKCGADLLALQACRGVLSLIAGAKVGAGDGVAWLSCSSRRALAAIDCESTVALRAKPNSLLAQDHPYLLAACRLLRVEGLFHNQDSASARRRAAKKSARNRRHSPKLDKTERANHA
jgi:hypothetical protein